MRITFGSAAGLCLACAAAFLGRAGAAEIAPDVMLSGDLRVRHESVVQNDGFASPENFDHARMRVRVGLDVVLDGNWDLSLRLATGGGATSTNQDLNALGGDKAELYVDRAFAKYHTGDARVFELFAGRMPNPYRSSMMIWDSDFNPDGLAERFAWKGDVADFSLIAGQHVLAQESATDDDYGPALFALQPRVTLRRGEGVLEIAVAYYRFVEAGGLHDVPAGSDYAIADVYACWKARTAGGKPWGLWADALANPEADDHNSAFGVGFDLGSTKGRGSGKLGLSYMSIDRNAIWVDLCDGSLVSDLTGEDMEAFVLEAEVGLGRGASLGATWYSRDSRETSAHEDLLQIDLVLKF